MRTFMTLIIWMMTLLATQATEKTKIVVGAEQTQEIINLSKGKRIGVVVNQTSLVRNTHLLDTLISMKIRPKVIFAPEHGYRGKADAGEYVMNGKDRATGINIISLYGKNKKPTTEQLNGLDMVIFDIQDVGARFYTYISTLYYVMQACAENGKTVVILDRPNPCDYIAGPVLDMKYKSFVGMMPIPLLHGCTIGELAKMINGEGWLGKNLICPLHVVRIKNWKHGDPYSLPIKPSPNLPNDQAIALYPSLCLFEATSVSVGRGTYYPFQVVGSPVLPQSKYKFCFTPKALPGFDKNPLHRNKRCYGIDLREEKIKEGFSLDYFIQMRNEYKSLGKEKEFISRPQWLDLLMGTNKFRIALESGKTATQIMRSWEKGLQEYKAMRQKYVIYEK